MNKLTHASLFSGIGGLDLAAEAAGFQTVCQCEWADFPYSVLQKHWPEVPKFRDITTLTKEAFFEKQDLKLSPSFQGNSPANPFQPPESAKALRIPATYGRKCAGLLPNCGPIGCLGKMLLASSIWGSTKRFLTWQKRDTLFSHSYFRLAVSARGMSASELLSSRLMFPTPLASDKCTNRDAQNLDVFLSEGGIFRKRNKSGAIWSLSLSAAVFYLTPAASDTAALNPDWVEWLMGFPLGWTDVSSGTESQKECPV